MKYFKVSDFNGTKLGNVILILILRAACSFAHVDYFA